jgi:hypothetical protein
MNIGRYQNSAQTLYPFDGYFSEINVVDGQALPPTAFGQTDSNGVWIPKAFTGTYGANGFHLDFSSGSNLGLDVAPNGGGHTTANNWSTSGIAATDQMSDTPTNNFATWNPIVDGVVGTFSAGSLAYASTSQTYQNLTSTIKIGSGMKVYWEFKAPSTWINNSQFSPGVCKTMPFNANWTTSTYGFSGIYGNGSSIYKDGATTGGTVTGFSLNDTVGLAYDYDGGNLAVYVNGTLRTTIAGISSGVGNEKFACLDVGSSAFTVQANFGQTPFASSSVWSTLQAAGYTTLSTANLPAIANGLQNPKTQFDTLTYAGNGTNQSIASLGFQPDFVWIKNRDTTDYHALQDSVRGAGMELSSNINTNEGATGAFGGFLSNGFSVSNGSRYNTSGQKYVSWCWKGGGTAVPNNAGTIPSRVSANLSAGFSVITYTGVNSTGTIGHGLGTPPSMIIVKRRDATGYEWIVWHKDVGA